MGPIYNLVFIYLFILFLPTTNKWEREYSNVDFLWEELGSVIKLQNPFRNKDIISIGIDMNNKHIYPA